MTTNPFDLTGKKAIIAGGAGDLGRGMIAALRDAGADIVVLDRIERLPEIAAELVGRQCARDGRQSRPARPPGASR